MIWLQYFKCGRVRQQQVLLAVLQIQAANYLHFFNGISKDNIEVAIQVVKGLNEKLGIVSEY